MRKMSFQYTHNSAQSALVAAVMGSSCFKKTKMEHSIKPKWYAHSAGRRYRFTVAIPALSTTSTRCMRWSARGVKVECAKPPSLNNVGPSLSVPVTSWLAQLPNGLQKAVDRLILLRTRGSPKFCEHQSTAKTHNNDKNPRAVWSWKEKKGKWLGCYETCGADRGSLDLCE